MRAPLSRTSASRPLEASQGNAPIGRNAGILVVSKAVGYVFPLLVLPMLSRPLGPAAYGELVYANSVVAIFYFLTEYGSQITATRAISRARDDAQKTSEIFSRVIVFRLLLCVFGYVLLTAFARLQALSSDRFTRLSLAYLITVGEAINPSWFFLGREAPMGFALGSLLSRAITIPFIALLVRSPGDVDVAVFLVVLPWLLGGAFCLAWSVTVFRLSYRRPSLASLAHELRAGFSAALSTASASINQPLSIVILGGVVSGPLLGVYGSAATIIAAAKQVLAPLSQLAYARTSYLESTAPGGGVKAKTTAVAWLAIAGALVSIGLLVAAPLVTLVLFGSQYAASSSLIRIMCCIPFVFIVGQAASTQFLFATGRGRMVVLAMAVGNVTCGVGCAVLVDVLHQTGAALALVIGESIAASLVALSALRARGILTRTTDA